LAQAGGKSPEKIHAVLDNALNAVEQVLKPSGSM
jgi:hypothetical protein